MGGDTGLCFEDLFDDCLHWWVYQTGLVLQDWPQSDFSQKLQICSGVCPKMSLVVTLILRLVLALVLWQLQMCVLPHVPTKNIAQILAVHSLSYLSALKKRKRISIYIYTITLCVTSWKDWVYLTQWNSSQRSGCPILRRLLRMTEYRLYAWFRNPGKAVFVLIKICFINVIGF